MKLATDWRIVLRRAWSVRLMILAVLLTVCEVALPFVGDAFARVPFAVLSLVVILAALVARIVAQRNMP